MASKFKVPDKKTLVAIIIIAVLLIAAIVGTVAFLKNRGTAEATELENYEEQSTATTQEEQSTTDTQEQSGETATPGNEEQTTEPAGDAETADTTTTGGNQGTAGTGATGGATGTTGGTGTTTTIDNIQESTITEYQTNIIPERLVLEGEEKIWTPRELQASFASAYINIDEVQTPDITVNKTATTKSENNVAQIGEEITYTITVQNNTNEKIERIYVTDTIPEKTTYVSSTSNAEEFKNGTVVTSLRWMVDIEANSTTSVNFTVTVNDDATGTIRNVAIANGEESNETQTPIIQTEKISSYEGELNELDVITYTIKITNQGDVEGTAKVSDTVPEGTTLVPNTIKVNGEGNYTEQQLNEGIDVTVPSKDNGGEATLTFQVRVNPFTGTETKIIRNAEAKVDEIPTNPTEDTVIKEYTQVGGQKTWITPEDKTKLTATIELLRDGEPTNPAITTTVTGDGAYSFDNLDKYDLEDGHEYVYTVREVKVDGYTTEQDGNNFKNTIEQETTSIGGTKTWVTPEDKTKLTATIELLRDGEPTNPAITTTVTGDGAYSFDNLDKYDLEDGHEYVYTVREIKVDGYTTEQDGNNFKNTIEQATTSIGGTKTWVTPEDKTKLTATIELLRDGEPTNPATTTTVTGDGTYSFDNLDKYDLEDGHEYVYTVREVKVDGYTTEQDGNNFKNTIEQETTSIGGTKTWVTPEDKTKLTATIELLRDGEPTNPATTTTVTGDGAYSFDNLDKYDLEDGHEYVYTVREVKVDGYTTEQDGNNFKNTIEQETTSIGGTKTWVTPEDKTKLTATIELLRDGEPTNPATTTTVTGDGAYSFDNLEKYDLEDGHEYVYTVREVKVDGYTTEQDGNNFKNTIEQATTSIGGTKTWVTPEDKTKLTATIELLRDGEPTNPATTTTVTGDGAYSFDNLEKYDLEDGHEYVYTVREVKVDGYTTEQDGNNFKNTIEQATTSIGGTKTWVTPEDKTKLTATIELLRDGEPTNPATTTTVTGDGAYSFDNLDKYDLEDGHEYVYTVREVKVDGYTTEQDGNNFKNTIEQETTSIGGTKTWVTPEDKTKLTATIELLRDGEPTNPATTTTVTGDGAYSFDNLEKYDLEDGHEYVYTVREVKVDGYTTEQDGNNFKNTIEQATTSIGGTKTWVTPEDKTKLTATIELLRDGEPTNPATTTTVTGDGAYSFDNLEKYDLEDGHEYVYTVREVKVDGYTTEQDGNNFKNTIEQATTSIGGTKTWVTPEDKTKLTATIELLRDGEPTNPATTTTVTGDGAYSFDNLEKYDLEDGHEYVYTVREVKVDGYTTEQDGNNFKNTIEQATTSIGGTKTWVTPEDKTKLTATIELLRDGEPTNPATTTTVTGDGAYSFDNLEKYDLEDGHEYVYTVREVKVDGYTTEQNGNDFENTIEQEYITIEGTKTWDDMNNPNRPDSITINLKANGKVTGEPAIVTADEGWKYKFETLPKYDSEGNIIQYTIEENPVDNYKTPIYTPTEKGYDILNSMDVKETSIEKTVSSIIKNGKETQVTETGNKVGTETTYPKTTVASGDTIIYDIAIKNEGNTTLQNVNVTDNKAVTIIGITPTVDGVAVGDKEPLNVPTTANSDNLLTLAGKSPTLEKGQGYIITVSYKVQPTDVADVSKISNTAKITADDTGDKYSTATVMVEVKFDHDIRKEIIGITGKDKVSKGTETEKDKVTTITYDDEANKGDTLTYKITAVNNGTTTIESLKISDDRDVKVLTVKFSSEKEEYTINQDVKKDNNLLVGNTRKTLEPGESVEIIVTYEIGSMVGDDTGENTSTILNTAILEGKAKDPIPDPESQEPYRPVNDKAEAIIEANMKANITIKKESTTNGQELNAGSTVTYTVTLTNSTPVTGTTTVKESRPENTTLVGNITVNTSENGTGNPTTLTQEQINKMAAGTLELTVPGNGWVTITFTVKLENEAIGTTVENTAYMGEDETPTDTISNDVKKSLNIYETKTEYGKQSVVLVVDMTLSLAADIDTNNTDRLAYTVGNGPDKYELGYQNTRWYKLKTALDNFIDAYLGDNPGNKKSVAIVGFCGEAITTGEFYTSADDAKAVYANVFTQEQYTAAVQYAESCGGDEDKFKEIFDKYYAGSSNSPYEKLEDGEIVKNTPYKYNTAKGAYDIDVDILECHKYTVFRDCGLSSGTDIVKGLNAGNTLVRQQTRDHVITNAIIITDGIDNRDNSQAAISTAARNIMNNSVNGEDSKLYAIGFTSNASGSGFSDEGRDKNCTEYFYAENADNLNTAFDDIIKDTDTTEEPDIRWATVETQGYVSLDGIELLSNSKITFYTGNTLTDNSTVIEYANLQEFINSGYYNANNKTFNLKQFLINKNVDASATINMQVYTEK